jgi:hypothetical protein
MSHRRLHRSEAQRLWDDAIRERGWEARLIVSVMFDWPIGHKTKYHCNPPAFNSIADKNDTVDEQEYLRVQNEILTVGQRHSERGRARRYDSTTGNNRIDCEPAPISKSDIEQTIWAASNRLDPRIATQEQILRCAFVAALPDTLQRCIGTLSAAVHPELPTASNIYQRKGKTTRRARIDLGFGHPTAAEGIIGAVELKALHSFNKNWFDSQIAKVISTPPGLMFSGMAGDFQKVLDPKIPNEAFRCSWAVTKQRGRENRDDIANLAAALLLPVEQRLSLEHIGRTVDLDTGWLRFEWERGISLHLAWYRPMDEQPDHFEPVWHNTK